MMSDGEKTMEDRNLMRAMGERSDGTEDWKGCKVGVIRREKRGNHEKNT